MGNEKLPCHPQARTLAKARRHAETPCFLRCPRPHALAGVHACELERFSTFQVLGDIS